MLIHFTPAVPVSSVLFQPFPKLCVWGRTEEEGGGKDHLLPDEVCSRGDPPLVPTEGSLLPRPIPGGRGPLRIDPLLTESSHRLLTISFSATCISVAQILFTVASHLSGSALATEVGAVAYLTIYNSMRC